VIDVALLGIIQGWHIHDQVPPARSRQTS